MTIPQVESWGVHRPYQYRVLCTGTFGGIRFVRLRKSSLILSSATSSMDTALDQVLNREHSTTIE